MNCFSDPASTIQMKSMEAPTTAAADSQPALPPVKAAEPAECMDAASKGRPRSDWSHELLDGAWVVRPLMLGIAPPFQVE